MKYISTSFCIVLSALFSSSVFAGGCDVNASITVNGPTTICSNDSVELIANPGVSYLWTNGATTQSIWVNQPGPNRVNVTDSNGCSDNSNFVFINVIPAPTANILSDQLPPYCMGDTVTLFTLSLPFDDFEWSTGETGPTIQITQSGLYGVTVTNFAGCSDTAQFPAAFLPAPFLSVTADGPLAFCEGQDVKISVNFGFGLDFLWAPNGETGSNITVDQSGTYNVTATNFFGCSATSQDFVVDVVPIPTAYAEKDTLLCFPDTLLLFASGGTNYAWSDGSTGSLISVVPDFGDSQYIVTVSNPGCSITAKDTVFIHVGGDVAADFLVTPALLGDATAFTDLSTGSIVNWNWDFGNGDGSSIQNPAEVYLTEDSFTVVLIVADQYGCSDTAQQSFFIEQVLTVPNVFTPNGDDYNDSFYIRNKGDGGFVFTVINRWGQVVFNTEGQEVLWSGRSNAGQELPAGTYYYVLKVDLKEGEEPVVQKGFITLIKG
ncbi:MAG: gliding motility-associated C-terminal domain-containing protein [Bacteroidia bacterium]